MGRKPLTDAERAFGRGVGRFVAEQRAGQALSGEAVARSAGMSLDEVRSIEAGRIASPGLLSIARLAGPLRFSIDELVAAAQVNPLGDGSKK